MKYLFFAFLLVVQFSFSQETKKKILLSGFYIDFNKQYILYDDKDQDLFYTLTKSSFNLPDDMDSRIYFNNIRNNKLRAGVCFDISKKMEIKVGLGYIFGDRRSLLVSKKQILKSDTIALGTDIMIRDSIINSGYILHENLDELTFDLVMLYRSDPGKKANFYCGIGVNLGYTVHADISYDKTESISKTYRIDNETYTQDIIYGSSSEFMLFDYANSLFIRAFVPIGGNFQLTDNKSFTDNIKLNLNVEVGIENQHVSGKSSMHEYYSLGAGLIYLI